MRHPALCCMPQEQEKCIRQPRDAVMSLETEAVISGPIVREETSAAFKRRFMIRMIAVLTGGMLLDGYILGVIGPVTAVMKAEMGMSTVDMGLIASAALFGILIGSPLGGWAGDKFGRKPLFMIDMGLFVLASAMQFFILKSSEINERFASQSWSGIGGKSRAKIHFYHLGAWLTDRGSLGLCLHVHEQWPRNASFLDGPDWKLLSRSGDPVGRLQFAPKAGRQ